MRSLRALLIMLPLALGAQPSEVRIGVLRGTGAGSALDSALTASIADSIEASIAARTILKVRPAPRTPPFGPGAQYIITTNAAVRGRDSAYARWSLIESETGRVVAWDSARFAPPSVGPVVEPVLAALRFISTSGTVQGADGVRLFYRRVGAQKNPVAIMLHGGPGSNMNAVWPDLERLAEARAIVRYDQRGGGRSEIIHDPALLTADHHVRDLEALRVNLGLSRFALIGESWGAGLAILYAAKYPQHVESLLLIGPMPPTRAILERRLDESDAAMGIRRQLEEIRVRMRDAVDPIQTCREFFSLYTKQFFVTPDGMSRRRGSSCDAPPEGVRNYFLVNQATFASLGNWDFRPVLKGIRIPALVIEGEQSIPSTVESARVMAASLPNATLVLVPGAGHYPQVEQPAIFFEHALRFLSVRR